MPGRVRLFPYQREIEGDAGASWAGRDRGRSGGRLVRVIVRQLYFLEGQCKSKANPNATSDSTLAPIATATKRSSRVIMERYWECKSLAVRPAVLVAGKVPQPSNAKAATGLRSVTASYALACGLSGGSLVH